MRADKFDAQHLLEIPNKLREAVTRSLTITKKGDIEAVVRKTKISNKLLSQKKISKDE